MQNNRLPGLKLTLLLPMLLLTACASKPSDWQHEQVSAPAIPTLPSEARQQPSPAWCSPTCSAGLTKERASWQQLMTEREPQG